MRVSYLLLFLALVCAIVVVFQAYVLPISHTYLNWHPGEPEPQSLDERSAAERPLRRSEQDWALRHELHPSVSENQLLHTVEGIRSARPQLEPRRGE